MEEYRVRYIFNDTHCFYSTSELLYVTRVSTKDHADEQDDMRIMTKYQIMIQSMLVKNIQSKGEFYILYIVSFVCHFLNYGEISLQIINGLNVISLEKVAL